MKKVFIIFVIFVSIFYVKFTIYGSEISNVLTVYGEIDNNKYFENSKQFVFHSYMLDNEKILSCLNHIRLYDDYKLEFIYNIYGEAQYLLIESTSLDYKAYIIYDFMLEEAIEYSCERLSDWSFNSDILDSIKLYLNLNNKFYVKNDALYDLKNTYICDIDVSNFIVEPVNFSNQGVILEQTFVDSYSNKIVRSEYDIENAFFFKNFQIDLNYNFNNSGTCAVVSAALLLSYYDVFYNDSIVSTYETYDGTTYLTKNRVAKILVDDNDDDIIENFYIDLWNSEKYKLFYPYEYSSDSYNGYAAPAGPSKGFHDYLVEIATDKGYLNDGMTIINTENLISDYLNDKNILNLTTCRDIGRTSIIDVLETDTPVIIGMTGYDYYFKQGEDLVAKRDELDCSHAVVAYGYQDTSIGLFFHVNMGWPTSSNTQNYYNDTYVNAWLMGYYTYLDSTNLEHICGYHYMLYNDENSQYIEICTCESFEDNFNFISSNLDYDLISYDGRENPIKIEHLLDKYEVYNERQHIKKCRLFEYCEKSELEDHNFVIIGSSNDFYHYIKCRDCGYTKYESHLDSDLEIYDFEHHSKYCSYCLEDYNISEHNILYSGNDEFHEGICRDCNYEISMEEHNITIGTYNDSHHQYLCNCGYERYESHTFDEDLICTLCGYEHLSHTYSYSKYSGSQHIKYCLCGEEIYESHSFNIGLLGNICKHCGYFTKDLVTIDSVINDKEYDANSVLYLDNMDKEEKENDK